MEKRKVVPQRSRKPKEFLSIVDVITSISKQTGFRRDDIKSVVDAYLGEVAKGLEQKKQVTLAGIGILYPVIKPARVGMSLNGGIGKPTRVEVPNRWMTRYQASRDMESRMFALPVSKEEIEAIYVKK